MTQSRKLSALFAGLIALTAISSADAFGSGDKIAPGNNVKFKVKSVQMGITAPAGDTCPTNAKMGIWFRTNKPGPVTFMVVRKGQSVFGPKVVQSIKGAGGVYLATYMQDLTITSSIDTQYRALIADGTGRTSNWITLKVEC